MATSDTSSTVKIEASVLRKINFACHQSAFAILRELKITNLDDDQPLTDLRVTLTSSPGFLKPKTWVIDTLSAASTLALTDRDLSLDGGFLMNLDEAIRGLITLQVTRAQTVLAEETIEVELLARNEWGGATFMPELLAAFCTPNDPAVDNLLGKACDILRNAGKAATLDGYTTNSREKVWLMASAIYSAIVNLQLGYAIPPASFENNGQKIRLPGHMVTNRVATCLDSTLLFAAAFEQAGLNPLVILTKDHALVGLWLQNEDLSSVLLHEAEILRQRVPLKELILIETTLTTQHPAVPFSRAVQAGAQRISLENDPEFVAAIDIRRARGHQINPIGIRPTPAEPDESAAAAPATPGLEMPPDDLPDVVLPDSGNDDATAEGRLERWQRKLLDLSARNPLLNHRANKVSLKLVCHDPGALEDLLADGRTVSIEPFPKLSGGEQDEAIHQQRTGEDLKHRYAQDALTKRQVLVELAKEDLEKRAVDIYRKSQTSLKEGGTNTLFLAIGFLYWKPREQDRQHYRAPLILLPVSLERKSVRSGIRMSSSDDEPRFNTTLLEMLSRDFGIKLGGLDRALPQDAAGIDVQSVWTQVRQAIKTIPGFEVVEDVVLGHFSFAKYLMWKDLADRTDQLKNSPVVRHLLETPRAPYQSEVCFIDPQDLDRRFSPSDLLTPLPADSAQMAAIATADAGKDFVIIGPPGTGKSQTIANLIAHLLGKGKRVLFVSEKTAALEVVHRRLKDIGLGQFCLELHSNKARKADVLSQLRSAWDSHAQSPSQQWQREADRLKELRDRLNHVIDALHRPRRNGMTAHHAIGMKVLHDDLASSIKLSWPTADHHDERQFQALKDSASLLGVQAASIGKLAGHPLQAIGKDDWRPQWQDELIRVAGLLKSAAVDLSASLAAFEKALGIDLGVKDLGKLAAATECAQVLLDAHRTQAAFALGPDAAEQLEALENAVALLKQYVQTQTMLSCQYPPLAWQALDIDSLESAWTRANNTWWPKKLLARHSVLKVLRACGAQGKVDADVDIAVLKRLRDIGQQIDRMDAVLQGLREWRSYDSEPEKIASLQTIGHRIRSAVGKLADTPEALTHLRTSIRSIVYEANDLLASDAAVGKVIHLLIERASHFDTTRVHFEGLANTRVDTQLAIATDALPAIEHMCIDILDNAPSLRDWCSWIRRRSQAYDLQLGPLVNALEEGRIAADQVDEVFESAYCSWWSAAVIGEDEVLRTFSSAEHQQAIQRFRELDTKFCDLTARYIAARLAQGIPDPNEIQRSSAWGVLRHELQKKMRHKPVRQLMEDIPEVITALAPCLMMSPLSIAQFLAADQAVFDVVIFDEASQITVWDAVGSLARGKQVIVAGDPKQMPPTNFFSRADDDPDGEVDEEGDLESILDELIGASIPQCVLNLHYRSRRESLIAFSNSRYYDDSLVTFPAPIHPDRGVSLIRPQGFYARGKARHNQGEAKAIVAEIIKRLTATDPLVRQQSIGVVTFNTEQQSLIEDLLDKARAEDPSIEWAFAEDGAIEPVFVKNLETVQGDERDVILFSITYGPDESDHLTMNFGPLNRTGGERRLNVALTRARAEMVVFSTLSPERMDLTRTQARAVADLKHFLEYAERGPAALGAATRGSMGDFESPFETAVARALQAKGWRIHPQVGVSAYRIDLGIIHPEKPGLYLAGIECDGAMYHSSASARERDKIRQRVLEGLGWTLIRIWSTDWWTNRNKALEQVHNSLVAQLGTSAVSAQKAVSSQ